MKIIIYGFGSFAKLMHYYQKIDTDNKVIAFCVDDEFKTQNTFCDLPVIKISELLKQYPINSHKILIAVGYSNMRKRTEMYEKIMTLGYQCINYINTNSFIDESVEIGMNNIILPGTVIEPFTSLGDNNIIWASVNISHDVKIDSHNFIATNTTIGGFSSIGKNCFFGFNSVISSNLNIKLETLVGSNSLMLTNSKAHGKYLGSPAKFIDQHKETGIIIK